MPKIRLLNRRRKGSSRRNRKKRRRGSGSGAVTRAFKSGMREARKLLRGNRYGGGELTTMANRRKRKRKSRRRQSAAAPRKRRRRNPIYTVANRTANMPRRRRRSSRRRKRSGRRRNPARFGRFGNLLTTTAPAAIIGGITTRALPAMVLMENNVGIPGYIANGVSALLISAALSRFWNKQAGDAALVGGAVMVAGRLVEDFMGQRLVEFGAIPGLGNYGDKQYNLMSGEFVSQHFPVPYSSLPQVTRALPPAAAVAENNAVVNNMAGPWGGGSPWAN